MKRKEIIGHLNDVAELACNVRGSITLINPDTKKKIEIDPAHPRYLKVVWGLGYKMEQG